MIEALTFTGIGRLFQVTLPGDTRCPLRLFERNGPLVNASPFIS